VNCLQLLYRDDGCSLTPRFPEYNCRKFIGLHDSCIRQTARFSGRHFGTDMGNSLCYTCSLRGELDLSGLSSGVTMGWLLRLVTGGPSGKGAPDSSRVLMINFLMFVFDVIE